MRPDLRNIGGVPATRVQQGEIAVGINAEFDRIVTLEPRSDATEHVPSAAQPVELTPLAVPVAPVEARSRPRWIVPAAIFAVGLIASGALGYFLYTTSSQLTSAKHQLATTQAALTSTQTQLGDAQAEARHQKQVRDYQTLVLTNQGKVLTDYESFSKTCKSYDTCLNGGQAILTELQAFQSARQSATVPSELSGVDSQLGDSISAGIASLQEFVNGMETFNSNKITDGLKKLDSAMLSMSKAEAALGAQVK
jgi:multidrug efflux pump subunit AcrA (membrane-fusion protein)